MGKYAINNHSNKSALQQSLGKSLRVLSASVIASILLISCQTGDHSANGAGASGYGGSAGYAPAGYAYAQANCSSCHAIDAGQAVSRNPAAPTFESLANRPDMTRMTLSALLRMPHSSMPSFSVDPDAVDDLSAYLSTLDRG